MTTKKTLIVDCDGVLYPTSQLDLQDFVSAMKETYRNDLQVTGDIQSKVSADTIKQERFGMFNYIKCMCEEVNYDFDLFCQQMFDRVDYGKINRDDELLTSLLSASRQDNVVILTNNHILHLDKVLQKRFGKNVSEIEELGIKCYDITSTEKNGVFYPKQDYKALLNFAEQIEQKPEDCVLIDDSAYNIKSAEKAGMKTVLITPENDLKKYLANTYKFDISKYKTTGREND